MCLVSYHLLGFNPCYMDAPINDLMQYGTLLEYQYGVDIHHRYFLEYPKIRDENVVSTKRIGASNMFWKLHGIFILLQKFVVNAKNKK